MKRLFIATAVGASLLGAFAGAVPAAYGAQRSVTLGVPMWCASCPYIVKRSLEKVAGVLDVVVSYEAQTATVRYDDEKATIAALTQATADVGFPSKVASSE
ncbi:MAG: mercuric transport protein periplasmic component [Kiloniellaceae bacterium]|nr:mercuric transport protein periplasmic component [Kiloniellaceae bacterium]